MVELHYISMKWIITISVLCIFNLLPAQSDIFGVWKAIDDKDGDPSSHLEIFKVGDKAHAKVVKIYDQPADVLCEPCKGDKHNKPVLGMEILWDMQEKGTSWSGGRIMDPENGKDYKCKITQRDEDTLDVRGYIGIPALGRTQTWYRVK